MKIFCFIAIILVAFGVKSQVNDVAISFQTVDTTETIEINVLKFYISDVRIQFDDNTDTTFYNTFYLIDIQDSTTSRINLSNIKKPSIREISFSIGTDSLTNVSGAFDGALDPINGMFWTWNTGYINVKMEGNFSIQGQSHEFEYHIGGYSGLHKTIRTVNLRIDESSQSVINVQIDLNSFMHDIDLLKTNRVMSPGIKAALLATNFAESFYVTQ